MFVASSMFYGVRMKARYCSRWMCTSLSVKTGTKIPEPEVLLTEYGELVNVKPMKEIKNPEERKYREVYMIDDNSSVKVILHTMDTNKNCFFLFDPDKTHYTNSMSIFRAIRTKLFDRYFGEKPEKLKPNEKPKKIKNAFSNCKTPLDLFHKERNVRMNIAQQLGRIGYFVDKGFELNIMGDNKPEIKNLKTVIQDRVSNFNKLDSYKVPDYFVPVNMLVGLINSQEWQKNGVEIACLENRLIYPHYGVWSPTSQEYLNLLDLYMKSFKKTSDITNTIDIGCGTGVLGIVASKYGLSGEFVGIDNNADAVECTKMNAQVHGLGTKMKAMQLDITKLYYSDLMFDSQSAPILLAKYQAYRKILHELGIPSKYDLILCNPPWIPASKVVEINPLDNGVYDPDEKFLKSAINFAKLHLTGDKKGRLLLAYSDLAQIIGLQDKERVEDLCHKAGLVIEEVYQTQMQPPKRPFDVLANYKQEAKVQLFEIFKQ